MIINASLPNMKNKFQLQVRQKICYWKVFQQKCENAKIDQHFELQYYYINLFNKRNVIDIR